MSPTEANKAIVRRVLELLDKGNIEGACAGHPGLYETRQRQPHIRAAFPDIQTTIDQQIAEADTVATRATMSGTHLGPFMGVAPTGKHLTWGVLLMNQIVDGKIVLHHANADWLSVLFELGLIRPPGETGSLSTPGS